MKAVFEKRNYFNLICREFQGFKGFPPMFHSHCELIYVISGELKVIIDGIEHILKPGEISIVFPYVTHCYDNAPDADAMIFLFDASSAGVFGSTMLSQKPKIPFTDKLSGLKPLLKHIIELANTDEPISEKTAISYFGALIGEIINVMPLENSIPDAPDISQRILNYCGEHFTDEDISIEKIAEALYISPSYISKIFSNKLKYKFREYINVLRISHAKKLIASSDMKIIDIMCECGFKNQSSFNRVFFDICGISPRDYRKSKLKK